jgi:hypothetical protein
VSSFDLGLGRRHDGLSRYVWGRRRRSRSWLSQRALMGLRALPLRHRPASDDSSRCTSYRLANWFALMWPELPNLTRERLAHVSMRDHCARADRQRWWMPHHVVPFTRVSKGRLPCHRECGDGAARIPLSYSRSLLPNSTASLYGQGGTCLTASLPGSAHGDASKTIAGEPAAQC